MITGNAEPAQSFSFSLFSHKVDQKNKLEIPSNKLSAFTEISQANVDLKRNHQ